MKLAVITGYLSKDATFGEKSIKFSLPLRQYDTQNKEQTVWASCWVALGKSEKRQNYLKQLLIKGRYVTVSGDFSLQVYKGNAGINILVSEVSGTMESTKNKQDNSQDESHHEHDFRRIFISNANDEQKTGNDDIPF